MLELKDLIIIYKIGINAQGGNSKTMSLSPKGAIAGMSLIPALQEANELLAMGDEGYNNGVRI